MAIINLLCAVVLLAVVPVQSEHHSLYYIYTALSKPVSLPGIYEFTAMGLLNDRQVDYYNSQEQKKIPKQHWMEQKMEKDYWDKGTQSRKSKQQWFNVNVNILMERMRHNNTDVHVLQWRHGCEINLKDGTSEFIKGIDEYSYDGENFLSFDDKDSQWVAPVNEALPTKRKWDNVPILNQYTKGYLEKECVDWLNKFREYGDEELKKHSPPEVHVFAKRTVSDTTKLKLTCLATGFYPKDVTLKIRKYRTSLPDSETESTGVRPNHDGTYQLRTSVEIKEDEKADYECYVTHRTLTEPIIVKWKGDCNNCTKGNIMHLAIGIVLGALIVLGVAAGVFLYRRKRRTDDNSTKGKAGSGGDISSDSGKESLDGSDPMLPSGKESPDSSDPMLPSGTTGTEGGSSSDSGKSSGSEENRFSNFLGKTPV